MATSRLTSPLDRPLLLLTFLLVVIGLITLASASGPVAHEQFGDGSYLLTHQLLFGLLPGVVGGLTMAFLPLKWLKTLVTPLFLLTLTLLILVFVPGIGAEIGTAHSWIRVAGFFTFQPSELLKLTLILFLATWVTTRQKDGGLNRFYEGCVPFALLMGVISILLIQQPDVGTLSILIAIGMAIYFAAGAPLTFVSGFVLSGVAMIGILIAQAPYRLARLTTFLHPELDPQGIGYHVNQALLAIGSGGWLGVGYGKSLQKSAYLPEVASDSIFAVFAEEMGWIASVVVLGLFVWVVYRLINLAKRSNDTFERSVLVGVAMWIAVQTTVNIGAMVAILPITGVPLPFFSYGGTSLAILLTSMGLAMRPLSERTDRHL